MTNEQIYTTLSLFIDLEYADKILEIAKETITALKKTPEKIETHKGGREKPFEVISYSDPALILLIWKHNEEIGLVQVILGLQYDCMPEYVKEEVNEFLTRLVEEIGEEHFHRMEVSHTYLKETEKSYNWITHLDDETVIDPGMYLYKGKIHIIKEPVRWGSFKKALEHMSKGGIFI